MTDASDIVARLRALDDTNTITTILDACAAAAAEIERLRIYLNLAKQLADAVERRREAAGPQPMISFTEAYSEYADAAAHEKNAVMAFRDAAKEWPADSKL
jgi:hypothetical protein